MKMYTYILNNLNIQILYQCCPKELPMMMGMFYICAIQYSGNELHVANEHLQYRQGH